MMLTPCCDTRRCFYLLSNNSLNIFFQSSDGRDQLRHPVPIVARNITESMREEKVTTFIIEEQEAILVQVENSRTVTGELIGI